MTLLKGKGVPELNRHTVQKVDNRPVEITVVKKVDNFVLLMRNVEIETEVMENNAAWRFKTYEAFKDKAINISEEYGVDFDEVELPPPSEKPIKCLDGYSEVLFVARIPINIIRKELN